MMDAIDAPLNEVWDATTVCSRCAQDAKKSGGFECLINATLIAGTGSQWELRSSMMKITLDTMAATSANSLALKTAWNALRDS